MKNSGVFTIFSPLVASFLMVASWIWPNWFYPSLVLGSFFILWSCYLFYQGAVDSRYWRLALPPLLYFLASFAYLTVISGGWLLWVLVALLFIILVDYLRSAYFLINDKNSFDFQQRWSSIALTANILSFFWASAAIFNLQSFLSLSTWSVVGVSTFVCFLLSRQWLLAREVQEKEANATSGLAALIGLEVSFGLSLLPFAPHVLALMFVVTYHFSLQLVWRWLTQSLSPRRRKLYLAVSITALAMLVISGGWL